MTAYKLFGSPLLNDPQVDVIQRSMHQMIKIATNPLHRGSTRLSLTRRPWFISCGSGSPPGFATWRASPLGARVSFLPVRLGRRQHVQTVGWPDHVPGQGIVNRCCQCDNVCAYRARFGTKSNTPLLQTVEHATKILSSLHRQPRTVYPPVEGSE